MPITKHLINRKEKLMNNYSGTKPESFIKRVLKGWLYYVMGFVMNLWLVTVMMAMASDFLIVKFLLGIAALVIIDGLFFNFAYNAARRDRELIKFHGMEQDKSMSLKLALLVPIFGYIMYILLFLVKLGVFDGTILGQNGFNYYILLNLHTLPWIAMITDGRTLEYLTWGGMFGLLLIQLTEPATIVLTYELTLRDVDVKEIIFYGKKKKADRK